jgi:hypothetical protein
LIDENYQLALRFVRQRFAMRPQRGVLLHPRFDVLGGNRRDGRVLQVVNEVGPHPLGEPVTILACSANGLLCFDAADVEVEQLGHAALAVVGWRGKSRGVLLPLFVEPIGFAVSLSPVGRGERPRTGAFPVAEAPERPVGRFVEAGRDLGLDDDTVLPRDDQR